MIEVVLTIPSSLWMSANGRLHFREHAKRTKEVRELARMVAPSDRYSTATVWAFVQYPTAQRADPCNAYPVLKAAIDGLVDAGVFPDDDSAHLLGPWAIRESGKSPPKTYRVRLLITEWGEPWKTNSGPPSGGPSA